MRKFLYFLMVFALSVCSLSFTSPIALADADNFYANWSVMPPLAGARSSYAMSSDGATQALTLEGGDYSGVAGDVYVSRDYGETWELSLNLDYSSVYVGVSSTGRYMVAGGIASVDQTTQVRNGGYLYTSSDYGVTWTQQTNAGQRLWSKMMISTDGTKIFSLTESQAQIIGGQTQTTALGSSFVSTNSGSTFTESKAFPNTSGNDAWMDFDMSADGSKIYLVGLGEKLWKNVLSGASASWTSQTSTVTGIRAVRANAAGTKVWIAGTNNLYVNSTSGIYTSWTSKGSAFFTFEITEDEKYILAIPAIAGGSPLSVSTNSGTSWSTAYFNNDYYSSNLSWSGFQLAMSSDGQYTAADIGYAEFYQARLGANKMSAPSAVAGNLQATLSWSAPTVNSATISDYEIQQSTDGGATWSAGIAHTASTSTTRTITSLSNGTSYTYRIAAITEWGRARFSDSVTVIPATTPGAPTSVVGVRGNQSVDLTWTAPVSNGGHAISDYTIEYRAGSGSWNTFAHSASSATSITVTGLTNGTSYTFRVSSVTDMGSSAASTVSGSVTPLGTPAAPTSFSATYGNTNSALTWTAPSDNGGSVITDYTIEYSSNGGSSWSTFSHSASTATSITITGLTNGVAYSYRVSAVNAIGTGAGATTTTAGSTLTTIALTRSSVGTTNGAAFTTQPQITLRDQFSATLVSDSVTVITASISAGGTLVGTTTATASGGIATFSNLGVSGTVNSTYTVTYSASGVSGVTQSITVSTNTATISLSLTGGVLKAEKGNAITITAAISTAGKVKFYSNGKVIAGCASRTGTSSATCAWKPTTQGQYVRLTALLIPNSGIYSNVTSAALNVATSKRTGLRS
jgi:hypothetical protein